MSIFVDFVGLNTVVSSSFVTGTYDNVIDSNFSPFLDSAALPVDKLAAINLHRNGPYNFATFKQIRIHENPLTRYQRKNNLLSFSKRPEQLEITDSNNSILKISEKFGDLVTFSEPALVSSYHPLVYNLGHYRGETVPYIERFGLSFDYSNHITYFSNEELNKLLLLEDLDDEVYEEIKALYLNGALGTNASDIDYFEFLRYKQDVFPREINKYSAHVRQRTNYENSFWRDIREDRNRNLLTIGSDGFFLDSSYVGANVLTRISQSMWNLDAGSAWETKSSPTAQLGIASGLSGPFTDTGNATDAGILLNKYCHFTREYNPFALEPYERSSAPLYSRLHTVPYATSVIGPTGIPIPETSSFGPIFQGHALWEAGIQAGKNPFYSSYDYFIEELRGIGKDYSIVPEFKISDHVTTLIKNGSLTKLPNMLEITGGQESSNKSGEVNFYETYSTTDFLKHFAEIKNDHKDFEDPATITLTCKALKKFLAYDSFYPQDRSVDCAKQFFDSYRTYIDVFNASGIPKQAGFQSILDPIFAPGVLYNSIKSGIAVDYPIITTGSSDITGSTNSGTSNGETFYYLDPPRNYFDKRIPFEALVEPDKYLSNIELRSNVAHPSGSFVTGSLFWDGKGDNLYKKMMSNYLAEIPSFFLKNGNFTTISSLEQGNENFGVAELGKTYALRIKIFKTKDDNNTYFEKTDGNGDYSVPQSNNGKETITMYSRPSAFGPPVASDNNVNSVRTSRSGLNPCFTPPYYDGEAWIDFIWKAPAAGAAESSAGVGTRKFSISEIISSLTASAIRFDTDYEKAKYPGSINGSGLLANNSAAVLAINRDPFYASEDSRINYNNQVAKPLNVNSVQLPASINPLQIGKLAVRNTDNNTFIKSDNLFQSANENSDEARWIIQTKFETPILNFKDVELTVSSSNLDSGQTPRGMWHQYGAIPENDEGIYLQVTDVPFDFLKNRIGRTTDYNKTGSLADLCGFSSEPVKLGTMSEKVISEAVVAVPYIEKSGVKKFFEINSDNAQNAKRYFQALDIVSNGGNPSTLGLNDPEFFEQRAGASVIDQIRKMRKYVFPPTMDFYNYPQVTPFAMYIFEFSHTLTEQDLADIWQGLPPEIGTSFDVAEDSVSHPLLANQLLGASEGTDKTRTGADLPDEVRWMVFKVKKRAKTNYFDKLAGKKGGIGTAGLSAGIGTDASSENTQQDLVSYNWPYDFFSLVELVKIDAEIEFANIPEGKFEPKQRDIPEKVQQFAASLSRRRR